MRFPPVLLSPRAGVVRLRFFRLLNLRRPLLLRGLGSCLRWLIRRPILLRWRLLNLALPLLLLSLQLLSLLLMPLDLGVLSILLLPLLSYLLSLLLRSRLVVLDAPGSMSFPIPGVIPALPVLLELPAGYPFVVPSVSVPIVVPVVSSPARIHIIIKPWDTVVVNPTAIIIT